MSAVAVAVIGGVAAIGGAAIEANAASNAAGLQARGAANALQLQSNMYNQTVSNESPFLQAGMGATSQLNYLLGTGTPGQNGTADSSAAGGFGSLNAPFTADTFKSMSPAYQFQLQQGQQGTLNSETGTGALSGAALKDLTSFNQGLANTSFNTAFNQYQTQQSNTYQRLMGVASMGQGAASNQATGASNFGASIGQSATNIGTAQAGGVVGGANAIAGGLSSAANSASLPWLQANLNNAPVSYGSPIPSSQYPGNGGVIDPALGNPFNEG